MQYERLLNGETIQMTGNNLNFNDGVCMANSKNTQWSIIRVPVIQKYKIPTKIIFLPHGPNTCAKKKRRGEALTLGQFQSAWGELQPAWKFYNTERWVRNVFSLFQRVYRVLCYNSIVNILLRHPPTLLPWTNCSANAAHTSRCGLLCCSAVVMWWRWNSCQEDP